MYWLYREHHLLPSVFVNMGYYDQLVLTAFALREIEDNAKEVEKIKEMQKGG